VTSEALVCYCYRCTRSHYTPLHAEHLTRHVFVENFQWSPGGQAISETTVVLLADLIQLPTVETRFYCPQAFLSLNFQRREDVSELK